VHTGLNSLIAWFIGLVVSTLIIFRSVGNWILLDKLNERNPAQLFFTEELGIAVQSSSM